MPDIFTKPQQEKIKSPTTKTPLPKAESTNSPGLFSSFCPYPTGIRFMNQETDETIVLFLRRHFITNLLWILSIIFFLILPPLLLFVADLFAITFVTIPPQLSFVLLATYYVFILNYAFLKFINWFYHVGVVTQKRLIDLDVDNILHYHLAETEIADIVDVSYTQRGFFQSFFNYGDVPIQTEAIKANFEFEQSPRPAEVADIITDLRPDQKGGTPSA